MHDKCIAHAWPMHGNCMAMRAHLGLRVFAARVFSDHARHDGRGLKTHERQQNRKPRWSPKQARAWQMYGTCMATAWQLHGKCMATALQTHGKCMATAWPCELILVYVFCHSCILRPRPPRRAWSDNTRAAKQRKPRWGPNKHAQ